MGSGTSNEQSGSATLPLWGGRVALGSSTAPLKQQQSNEQSGSATMPLWCGRVALGSSTAPLTEKTNKHFSEESTNGATFLFCSPVLAAVFRISMADQGPAIDPSADLDPAIDQKANPNLASDSGSQWR
jgi:hypothetical protein